MGAICVLSPDADLHSPVVRNAPARGLALLVMALVTLATGAACAGSSASGTRPADVAVQSSDVPKALTRCDASGDMDSFLNAIKITDPATYKSTKSEWDSAKAHGATSAQVVFYSDSKDHCAAIHNSSNTDLFASTYPLVINFVIQFADESSAANGYRTESIFGFSQSTLTSGISSGVVTGSATGLAPNSVTLTASIGAQQFFIAVWQKNAFMVILGVLNVDPAASKKIAASENGRIH